ncbi:myomesin-1 [Sinocyclocheilus anshuiensis]|uniref:myomesin-1 n=1 Tax=Sinocyclocheilus anshuiensis TaxID=1608454 RepID=UPI0007B95E1B|nr:PREDICTED: myomesin-1 [Sinocyclocheilus anshuiensis]
MSGSIPFYQKHHRHYDRGYRSRETESAISQYQQSSNTYSSHSSKSTKGIRAATYTALDEGGLSPLPKRAKPTYLAMDKENQIIGYVVPIFRGSHEFESGLSDTEEARAKESAGYLARRDLFARGMESERIEHKSRRTVVRESAERISLSKRIHENEEYHKRLNEDSLMHTPEFVIKPRSHTVWEKQCVRLHCTISGWPEPRVVWYKNNVSIDPMAKPGKYKVESSYSVHALEINKCDFDDTAQYRVSAMNSKGETSAFASVVVKRFKGEVDESLPSPRLQSRKFGFEAPCLEYGVKFETHIVEKFGVSFGLEGETLSFGCSVIIYPSLQRFQPEIEWYRDDKLLVPSKWVQMHWSGDRATLTLSHLNKEDEGLYTLRVITKSGFETHSAYVFVRVGMTHWAQCNDTPVKFARFPVTGLVEGRSYVFRVRAVNKAGMSHPSRVSEPVDAMDPADRTRKGTSAPWTGQIIVTEEEPVDIPSAPGRVVPTRNTDTSVVVSWEASRDVKELVGYYIESSIAGSNTWEPCNNKPVKGTRFICHGLTTGESYVFRVRAVNAAGISEFSQESEAITVKAAIEPNCIQKESATELPDSRKSSVNSSPEQEKAGERERGRRASVLLNVLSSICGADFEMWRGVNEKATDKTFMKIKDLKMGESYVFRVRAQNKAGVGKASDPTEPVEAVTKPGTTEIVVNVDDDGVISLNFECSNLTADSKFVWSKNYMEMTEPERMTLETKGNKSKAIFKTPSEEDLGIYSCFVTHTDGASASYTLSEETLKELLKISHDHKFPIIPLKTELAVELLEKGRVRFWLQAEKISANGKVEYVFNDNVIHQGEKYKMNFDKNTGTIEMFMESLGKEDEGTFTFQLQDGKATNQSSLVLIGDVFKQLQKESEFQKKEWIRKQGPHFVEYLGYEVTPECCVRLKCKVANMKKDSVALWYKDGREIKVNEKLDFSEGVLTLEIAQISRKDAGIYEVVLKDDRGKDTSTLNLTDQGFKDLMNQVFSVIANSSTPLKIQSTEEGIRLYTFVSYYNDELHVTWHHKDAAIAFTERIKSGVVGEQLWLQISEPTEKDKGKYAIEFFDGKGGLRRTVELAGQAFDDAYAEFQRLKAAATAERNRARVAGGLPDVVTIQEGKSLNLTCNIWGDPVPEVTWLKNEREMVSNDHYILKFESGKFASFTITSVSTSDSGKYSILVKNKYGTESGDFTVSVFIPDEEPGKKK